MTSCPERKKEGSVLAVDCRDSGVPKIKQSATERRAEKNSGGTGPSVKWPCERIDNCKAEGGVSSCSRREDSKTKLILLTEM